jgi:hypothetical protein
MSMPITLSIGASLAEGAAELAPAPPDPDPASAPPSPAVPLTSPRGGASAKRGSAPLLSVEGDAGPEQATAENVRATKKRMNDDLDLETLPYQTRRERRYGCPTGV